MANVVIVGYGQMLYSLIEGIEKTDHKILGVLRVERTYYSNFTLFLKDIFFPSRDYTIIKSKKLHDIKATSVNSIKFIKEIKKLNPDLIIVGSWGERFKEEILNTVPCINFHPALLPKNRGANPYFWTIYLNQKVTGLTVHYMDKFFDKGDILLQEAITIDENETGKTLKNKTCALAHVMVQELLNLYDKKQLQPISQNEEFATYEKQIAFENTIINLANKKEDVYRHIRALYPWAAPRIKIARRYFEIINYEFLPLNEKYKDRKINDIVENNSKYIIVKGSDFLLKICK